MGKGGEMWCRKGKVMEGDADGMGEGGNADEWGRVQCECLARKLPRDWR